MVYDLRLVEIQERKGFDIKGTIGGIMVGGSLLYLAIYLAATLDNVIPKSNFDANTTAAYNEVKANIFTGMKTSSIVLILLPIFGVIGMVLLLVR